MLLLTPMESVTGLPLVITIGPMLGEALVGSVPSMVYHNVTLVVMSLTVNSAPLFPVIVGLATWNMNSAVTIALLPPGPTFTALITKSGTVVTGRDCANNR